MPATLRHFSINADDVQRAKGFYEAVFGWRFEPWGPPDFYLAQYPGVGCSLQGRREIVPGVRLLGVEASMAVDDVEATAAAVKAGGGTVTGGPYHIETVGTLIWIQDPEGNKIGAMRYDAPAPTTLAEGARFRHFAINADDVPRARGFYERVFGWTFDPWGPPDFYQTKNAGEGFLGALQGRRELQPGAVMRGFEATMGVEDIGKTLAVVTGRGGQVVMGPVRLMGVGELAFFKDTEGNFMGVMQYEPGVFD